MSTGTTKRDLAVIIRPDRLTISLTWAGRVLDGPLSKPVRASDACWALDGGSSGSDQGLLPRPPPWRGGAGSGGEAGGSSSGVLGPGRGAEAAPPEGCVDLMIVLPKAEGGRFWKSLFEGGPEKSHWELLHEAVHNEDDARWGPGVDDAGPEAQLLLEELLERQRMVADGSFDLERSFDDFRMVVGDNTL
ncbi:hypothetical protein MNEG_0106 [Monoraphidium neglectum]|uniref:CS domain-containing protein n=1 Tax=Monoraphidium neglectum TaxID=145388 RepID=A0A0D2KCP0_9CHLO|nr:hypothetical protein MNEG_0106 [Monoraphidium neglectum]KIZ07853.1 hypothetical protein MNEG_0106 [Monoraphidium neglectum]|eukprot:XP_013906872.1 hypothetical protein MNEG_0106 [Monoraphidium neglectum]